MQVVVQNLLVSYYQAGKGEPVLIIPGWADVAANWQEFANALAKHHAVTVLDLPGFGGSQAPTKAWGLDDYASFVAAFTDKVRLLPHTIIGHSNGGSIAIRGLAQQQLQAQQLVLLASAGIRDEGSGRKGLLKVIAKTGKVVSAPLPGRTKQRLRRKLYQSVGSDLLVAEHMQETFKKVVAQDVQADAARLSLPTLLVYGEHDEQTPVRYGQLLHEAIDGSTLEILPQADHFLYRSHTAQVVQLVEDFLR